MGTTISTILLFGLSLIVIRRARADKGMFVFSYFTGKFINFWNFFLRQAFSVKRIFAKN
jgi:hypothetical protein